MFPTIRNRALPLAITVMLLAATPVVSQDVQAKRIPDAAFVRVEMIKFRPGGEDRAFELEDRYINPAIAASGLPPPTEIHTQTGPWDRIYIYRLRGGLSDLEWQISPDRAAFLTALSKVSGGREKALAVMAEWDGLVERRESALGHKHPAQ